MKKPQPPRESAKKTSKIRQPVGSISLHPMQLQIGDRYSDETGEWEVVSRPVSFRGGKAVRARVQVPDRPESEKEDTWEAHQRITVRRG